MNAEELIEAWGRDHPSGRALVELLSLAVHVEPGLLRAARLALHPRPPVSAEGDLWFSPLVDAASPAGFTLRRDVTEVLRRRLAAAPAALAHARGVVERAHAQRPLTLRLQEELIWLGLRGDPDARARIGALWGQALGLIREDGQRAPAVARWALRALASAPPRARDDAMARQVAACAQVIAGVIPTEMDAWMPWMMPPGLGTVESRGPRVRRGSGADAPAAGRHGDDRGACHRSSEGRGRGTR